MTITSGLQMRDFSVDEGFTFIPYGLDARASKEAVKVHVLHERKRKARPRSDQQVAVRQGAGQKQSQSQSLVQGRILRWDSKPESRRRSEADPDAQYVASVAPLMHHARHLHNVAHALLDHEALRNPFTEQLRDGLGGQSVKKLRSTNFLVDHYLARCGKSMFPGELLSLYWQETAPFKAFLAHAAVLFSMETGLIPPVQVDELMCDALQEVNRCLSHPTKQHTNGTMIAVVILANVEEGRAQHQTANLHWKGLKQLLRVRGTLLNVRLQRDLHTMLLWREILTSNSVDVCLGHGIAENPEYQYCSEHLVAFFETYADRLTEEDACETKSDISLRRLAMVLDRDVVRRCDWTTSMQARAVIACLVYLAMLAVSIHCSVEANQRIERIVQEVNRRDKYGQVGQEELLFIFLQHGDRDNAWRVQQLWQLSRCVYLTRGLAFEDWKTMRDMLSWSIGCGEGCDEKLKVHKAWQRLSRKLLQDGCRHTHLTGFAVTPDDQSLNPESDN